MSIYGQILLCGESGKIHLKLSEIRQWQFSDYSWECKGCGGLHCSECFYLTDGTYIVVYDCGRLGNILRSTERYIEEIKTLNNRLSIYREAIEHVAQGGHAARDAAERALAADKQIECKRCQKQGIINVEGAGGVMEPRLCMCIYGRMKYHEKK